MLIEFVSLHRLRQYISQGLQRALSATMRGTNWTLPIPMHVEQSQN
jgi:hypothetical protein